MGELTDIIVDEAKEILDFAIEDFRNLEGTRDRIFECFVKKAFRVKLEHLGFYDQESYIEYSIRFNEVLMGRKDFQPYEIRDMLYTPERDKQASVEILSGLMPQALLDVEDNPKSFDKKEVYLYLLQKLAPLNFPAAEEYVVLFNQHQKAKAKKKGERYNQIFDRGKGHYVLASEKR